MGTGICRAHIDVIRVSYAIGKREGITVTKAIIFHIRGEVIFIDDIEIVIINHLQIADAI